MGRFSRALILVAAPLLAGIAPSPAAEPSRPAIAPAARPSASAPPIRQASQGKATTARVAGPASVKPAVAKAQAKPKAIQVKQDGASTASTKVSTSRDPNELLKAAELRIANLKAGPLEPTDLGFPINLATALRLSDARPLIVASAQASVWIAEAKLTRAKLLWVPTLNFAADYIRHDGGGPDFNKGILTSPSVNYFYAGGSLSQYVNLTDAIFEPLAARQELRSRQFDVQAAKNDSLQMTADAYFRVHESRGKYAGTLYAVKRGHDLVDRIARLSKDLVPRVEIDRARNMVADIEQMANSAREDWRVHSADLTQILRLDPRTVVVPQEHDHMQLTLIDPSQTLDDLMRVAVLTRPELASNRAKVDAAEARVRREKMRPVLPVVALNGFQSSGGMNIQAGVFGIGPNSSLNQWSGRFDSSFQLLWQLDAFGIGNVARVKKQRGEQSDAVVELFREQDKVAAEVTEAHARSESAATRVGQAEKALRSAMVAFDGSYEGLHETTRWGDVLVLVNRPQETVFSLRELKIAFDEYFATVAEYNRAQFALYHALGYPARQIAVVKPPGEILPVNTERPAYLPPVGEGPPPATR